MKIFIVFILILFTAVACATGGTSVGNGLASKDNKLVKSVNEIKTVKEYCEIAKAGKYTDLKCVTSGDYIINESELSKEFQLFIKK